MMIAKEHIRPTWLNDCLVARWTLLTSTSMRTGTKRGKVARSGSFVLVRLPLVSVRPPTRLVPPNHRGCRLILGSPDFHSHNLLARTSRRSNIGPRLITIAPGKLERAVLMMTLRYKRRKRARSYRAIWRMRTATRSRKRRRRPLVRQRGVILTSFAITTDSPLSGEI